MLSLDSNVLSAVFRGESTAQRIVDILEDRRQDGLFLHVAAFAEFLAAPGIQRADAERFLTEAHVAVAWQTEEAVWERAIQAFTAYAALRRRSGGGQPRRILADFLIGAHAELMAGELLTLDPQHYRQHFPGLVVTEP